MMNRPGRPARQFQVFCSHVARAVYKSQTRENGIGEFVEDLDRRFDEKPCDARCFK